MTRTFHPRESKILDFVGMETQRLFARLYGRELNRFLSLPPSLPPLPPSPPPTDPSPPISSAADAAAATLVPSSLCKPLTCHRREETMSFLDRRLYWCAVTCSFTVVQIILTLFGFDALTLAISVMLMPVTLLDRQWCALVTRMPVSAPLPRHFPLFPFTHPHSPAHPHPPSPPLPLFPHPLTSSPSFPSPFPPLQSAPPPAVGAPHPPHPPLPPPHLHPDPALPLQSRYNRSQVTKLSVHLSRALSHIATTPGMPTRFGLRGVHTLLGTKPLLRPRGILSSTKPT